MAAATTSNNANFLLRVYSRGNIAPFERVLTRFLDWLKDVPNEPAIGSERRFPIKIQSPQATGAAAEGSVFPDVYPPEYLQATVLPINIVGALGISDQAIAQARDEGTWGPTMLADLITDTIKNTLMNINRLTAAGHGTGRLAVVQTSTVASTTFVCRNPEHVVQLREGMHIDFFDTDTGGSKQGATEEITSINFETRTVTIGNARTLTATWGVYQALTASVSTYGVAPNGVRNIADDGTLSSAIYGITRSVNPQVNATVLSNGGVLRSYSETLMRTAVQRSWFQGAEGGYAPDAILCNRGIVGEYLKNTIPDRRYNVMASSTETPKYRTGYDESQVGYQWNGKFLPFLIEGDYPDREFVVLNKSGFRRHITRELTWIGDGTGDGTQDAAYLLQAPSSTTYSFNKLAGCQWLGNQSHRQDKFLTRVVDIADSEMAGDP